MKIFFVFLILNVSFSSNSKEYIVEAQGKRSLVKEHIYSKNDNLKIFKLMGTFKDSAGNFGDYNSIVVVKTLDSIVIELQASNEFIYNENIRAFNVAKRKNNELKQGIGKWLYTYSNKNIDSIVNSECIYSIKYFKESFLTIAKCDITENAFKQLNELNSK